MRISQLVIAALLSATGGCAPFMELPDPDPIWTATVGSPYIDTKRPETYPTASLEQKAATERARAHIAQSLPARGDAFVKSLERQNFFCGFYANDLFRCIYSKARPRFPCATSLRVSIQVDFPYNSEQWVMISEDDVDVAAFVIADRDQVDHRGCFPL